MDDHSLEIAYDKECLSGHNHHNTYVRYLYNDYSLGGFDSFKTAVSTLNTIWQDISEIVNEYVKPEANTNSFYLYSADGIADPVLKFEFTSDYILQIVSLPHTFGEHEFKLIIYGMEYQTTSSGNTVICLGADLCVKSPIFESLFTEYDENDDKFIGFGPAANICILINSNGITVSINLLTGVNIPNGHKLFELFQIMNPQHQTKPMLFCELFDRKPKKIDHIIVGPFNEWQFKPKLYLPPIVI